MNLDAWRWGIPLILAVLGSIGIDRLMAARGLTPPGFAVPFRRVLAMTVIAFAFFVGVFAPLGLLGLEPATEIQIETPQLFQLHAIFVVTLVIWYLLGFAWLPRSEDPERPSPSWLTQFGLRSAGVGRELVLGAGIGLGAWLCVLTVLLLVGSLIYLLAGDGALPETPPAAVVWIAALPLAVRFAISLSAGVVEELFFRGFLQPRIGIGWSTGAFVLAHLSYEQPLMLIGITLLSLIFAALVQWRQSIWAAIAAHAVFDGIQLLLVIPQLLELLEPGATGATPAP